MNRSGLGLSLVSAPETFNNNNYKYNICDAGRTLGDVIYQPGQAQACYSMQKAWFIYNTIHYTESSCFSDIYNDFSQYLTCKSGLTFSVSASRLLSFIKALQKFGMMTGSDIVLCLTYGQSCRAASLLATSEDIIHLHRKSSRQTD